MQPTTKPRRRISVPAVTMYFFAVMFVVYIIWQFFLNDPATSNVGSGKHEFPNFPWTAWKIALYFHIVTGSIALLIGPFQFLKYSNVKNKHLHRTLGKIYVASIMLSAPVSLYLAWYANGGVPSMIAFFFLALAWVVTTGKAMQHIRRREIEAHRRWMFRSYAVTFAFITFRFEVGFLIAWLGFDHGFAAGVWTALIGNLLFTEWLLRRRKSKGASPALSA